MLAKIDGGFLIAIEGIDGAGKTTQAGMLAQYFGQLGFPVVMSKEPTIRRYGAELRATAAAGRLTPEKEQELFEKDRREHVAEVIQPALDAGMIVILDRYYGSTAAYQGQDLASGLAIVETNEAFAPKPDALVVLDVAYESGVDRITKRGDKPNHFESETQLNAARSIFNGIEKDYWTILDGTGDLATVHQRLKTHILERMGDRIDPELRAIG